MKQRNILISGLSLVLMTSVSSVAMAQCTATGTAAGFAPQYAPFAVGGALNTLVSSINAANTAFLTQSTAFVGSPANPKPDQEGGGIWARGIGGEINTKNTVSSTYALGGNGSTFQPVATPLTGGVNCNTTTNLQFAGTQVGTDMARLNWNGWNVHMGSMAGYLGARARDTTAATPGINAAGSLSNSLEVPFVGAYAAATYGSFFIDGQIRWDFYQNTINDPIQNGLFNQKIDARGLAFTANAGYNFQLGNNWFIEPSAGIVISQVKVDPLRATGTLLLTGAGSIPNTTTFSNIESYLARLSVRVGTTIVSDKMIWQPFVTASVYHDFAGAAKAAYSESNNPAFEALSFPLIQGNLTANNLGTYGQFALGIAGQVAGTGWLGYLRADYRTGDRIEGYSLNGGLRYQFTPDMLALAPKGLITKAPALAAAPYNWNGFYIGATFAGLNGWTDWNNATSGVKFTNPRFAGAMAGGQVGYDWQFGKWVVGLEGMGTWTNANGARDCNLVGLFTCETGMNWMAAGTARVGYAYWDRALIYVKGGVVAAELTSRVNCNTGSTPGFFAFCTAAGADIAQDRTKVGWTIGYGTEFALTQNWTVKGETTYFDLGRERSTFNGLNGIAAGLGDVNIKTTGMIGTVGLNYRFATGGPVRY
jgi:opacity protein-like surface antigen